MLKECFELSRENGHVISWQRRDVNLPPDPILKLMAVAFGPSLYIIPWPKQRRIDHLLLCALRQQHEVLRTV